MRSTRKLSFVTSEKVIVEVSSRLKIAKTLNFVDKSTFYAILFYDEGRRSAR